MNKKDTHELNNVLGSVHPKNFASFLNENKEHFIDDKDSFNIYVKDLIKSKGLTQQNIFLRADIPERYGYKLLSGEKRTRQRDIILRICYCAHFTIEETQRALSLYKMPPLYPKFQRDAFIMILFNERPGDIIDVNELLKKNKFEPLRTSGSQD